MRFYRKPYAALLLVTLICCQTAFSAEVVKPAFEDATLTGDLDAKILAGGPMIAYSTPREVGIWVSTAKEARVRIAYYDETAVEKVRVTAEMMTARKDAFTVLFRCDRVEPGRKYFYKLYIDGKTHRLPFKRSFSTPALNGEEERLALLGPHAVNDAVYPPYSPAQGYEAIDALQAADPTAMFWVGNSTLVREMDNSSTTGYDLRYGYSRNWTGLQALQATVPQYAVPGRDDLGASAVNGWRPLPTVANATFDRFWPVAARANKTDLSYSFSRSRVAVFVLDAFTHRTTEQRYGHEQLDWLQQGLQAHSSKALRVVALGEPLTTDAYRAESKALMRQLRQSAKQGPIMLTAPGSSASHWIEHAPGLKQLVLGPFSRKPTPSAYSISRKSMIAEGQVFGLLQWSDDQTPILSIQSAMGKEIMRHDF